MDFQDKKFIEKEREIPVFDEFDVIVAGAGMAGCTAAIASGRQGVKTLLIERSGMLGGVSTSSMMASVTNLFFTNKNEQVIKGIPEEIIDRLVKEGVTSPNWRNHIIPQIPHNADTIQVVMFHMLKEAGVRILLHSWVVDTVIEEISNKTSRILKGLVIENKAGRQAIYGKVIVDCSGDGDIAYFSRSPMQYPGHDTSTVMYEMGNVDLQKTYEYYRDHREDFDEECDIALPFSDFEANWLERGIFHTPHNGGIRNTLLQNAIKEGKYAKEKGMAFGLDVLGLFGTKGSRRVLVNSNYFNIDAINDIEKLSQAELEGRERCLELGMLLTEIMPGFENAFVTRTASEIGTRITRNIDGEYMITTEDFFSVRKFDDEVCRTPAMEETARGVRVTDKVFGIPYRAFLPKGIDNLLIGSGKTISAESPVRWKCLRGQVNTMLIGETAGIAAAVAVKEGKTVKTVGIEKIREALEAAACSRF